MSKKSVIWAALLGSIALAVGVYASYSKAIEGQLGISDWTEWLLLGAVVVAGFTAISRPLSVLIGASAFALTGIWWALDSLNGEMSSADPVFCAGMGVVLLLCAVIGARQRPDTTADAITGS